MAPVESGRRGEASLEPGTDGRRFGPQSEGPEHTVTVGS